MREHGEKVLVKLFQKLTVSRGGAFAAHRSVRNPLCFNSAGKFLENPRRGFSKVRSTNNAPQKHSRLARLVTPHGVGRCLQSRQRGRPPSAAHRNTPCFFTNSACLHLPQAAAHGFVPPGVPYVQRTKKVGIRRCLRLILPRLMNGIKNLQVCIKCE